MRFTALIGNNISGSLSPYLHNSTLERLQIDSQYCLVPMSEQNFEEQISQLLAQPELLGFNVTIPFKVKIISFLYGLDSSAQQCDAVNCVYRKSGQWWGTNTDLTGFSKNWQELDIPQEKIGIIGGGGSAAAILMALLKLRYENLHLWVRNIKQGKTLLEKCGQTKNIPVSNDTKLFSDCSVLINCTPKRDWSFSETEFPRLRLFYDLNYFDNCHELEKQLTQRGVVHITGEKMLAYQAAESFATWHKISAPFGIMTELLQEKTIKITEIPR
jgi:shikimate dehydrogenase